MYFIAAISKNEHKVNDMDLHAQCHKSMERDRVDRKSLHMVPHEVLLMHPVHVLIGSYRVL